MIIIIIIIIIIITYLVTYLLYDTFKNDHIKVF